MKEKLRKKAAVKAAAGSGAPTMADVGLVAGVSAMTVSRVLNGDKNVRDITREKVAAAIAKLKYVPNQAARGLVGASAIRVGVLYSNPSAAYLTELLVGLLNQAGPNNVQLLVEKCEDQEWQEKAQRLLDIGVDGMILPPPLCDVAGLLDLVTGAKVPVVTVARGEPDVRASAVRIDDYHAAYAMTRHLAALGHARIGFIIGHPNQSASARRTAGFRAAMADQGLPLPDELLAQGLFTYRSGLDAAELLLSLPVRPTAIFASNDDMAAAVVAVAHRLGLDVPGDLTVVGFDDTAMATTIWPELTTVRQPTAEMAETAVQMLVQQTRAKRAGDEPTPEQILMPHTLVRRQSDAAPRRRPQAIRGAQ